MSPAVLWFALLLGFTACSLHDVPEPVVAAPAGTFRGKILASPSGATFASYRGIPYALPPTGERRFALPEAFPKIEDGIYDASKFGSICLQHEDGVSVGQEDCLFLNVYTPLVDKDAEDEQRKVLVFIHGGGFVVGASNIYIPGELVAKGNVAVVTINYRLGWLGFLRGNPESLPGNQAFHDQVLALKWVQENIEAFGGNPHDVTLAGESAGALSVSVLSISPLTRNLFNKAIVMSGTAFTFPTPSQQSRDLLETAQRVVGCENEENVISCLQEQPAENFEMAFTSAILTKLTSSGDALLPKPIPELVNDVEYLNSVGFFSRDYIVSITKHDGYIRVNSLFGILNITTIESSVESISKLLQLPDYVTELLVHEYLDLYEDVEKAVIALNTDYFYLQRSNYFLNAFGKGSGKGSQTEGKNIYFMSFDPSPTFFPKQYAVHAMDLVHLFDVVPKTFLESFYFLEIEGDLSEDDLKLKSDFIQLVASFVKTGNPNDYLTAEKNMTWLSYDSKRKNYLSFSLQPSVHQNLYGARGIIWDKLVPQWKKEHESLKSKQEL
ncbi:hypothetical protein BsWGS_12222 [Bradybaena similaris]